MSERERKRSIQGELLICMKRHLALLKAHLFLVAIHVDAERSTAVHWGTWEFKGFVVRSMIFLTTDWLVIRRPGHEVHHGDRVAMATC